MGSGALLSSRRDAPDPTPPMLSYFFPIPAAGTMVSNIASVSEPMLGDLKPVVWLIGGILLAVFVAEWVITLVGRLHHE